MKIKYSLLFFPLFVIACSDEVEELSSVNPINWEKRTAVLNVNDSLVSGKTYLSVYSQVYSQTEHKKRDLTATISMRNVNASDTVYIDKAEYFDTHGNSIRSYFNKTIYIAPMETLEIVIDEADQSGGTGANFIFDWKMPVGVGEPLFEAVMISTSGQQGISFTTQGKKIN